MEQIQTDEWVKYELSDICKDVRYGYTASSNDEKVGPKFLRITDIVPDFIDWKEVPYCEISDKDLEKYKLEKGDIVVARTGATTGYAKRIKNPPNAVFASYLVRLKIKEEFNDEYVGYVIESNDYKEFIKKNWSGAAQPNANAKVITSYSLKIPDERSQEKIASILSAFDDLIENNSRRIEILEEMARRIYREWFVHFRYPGHENDELVDSGTDLGEIPEGWEVKKLEDLCELTLGQSPKSEFYNEKGEGLPFHQGVRDFGDRYPTTTTWCVKDKRIAEEGDILFSVRAPVGRINIANTKMIIGRGLHSIRSKYGNQVFVFHQLKDKFQEEDTIGSGTIYKSVTKKIMLNLKLIDPGKEMIEKFEENAVPIFKQIKVLTDKNEKLKETRDLLLPKLISGKIEVKRELNYDSKKD